MGERRSSEATGEPGTRRSRWWFWLLVFVILLAAWYWFDRGESEPAPAPTVELESPAEQAADHDRVRRPAREPGRQERSDDRGIAEGGIAEGEPAPVDTPAEELSPPR